MNERVVIAYMLGSGASDPILLFIQQACCENCSQSAMHVVYHSNATLFRIKLPRIKTFLSGGKGVGTHLYFSFSYFHGAVYLVDNIS